MALSFYSVMQQCWLYRIFTYRFCYCDEKIVVLQEGTQYLHATPPAVEETASLDGVSWDYYLEAVCDALPPKVFFKFIWLCTLIPPLFCKVKLSVAWVSAKAFIGNSMEQMMKFFHVDSHGTDYLANSPDGLESLSCWHFPIKL